jgi:hypothetical protein
MAILLLVITRGIIGTIDTIPSGCGATRGQGTMVGECVAADVPTAAGGGPSLQAPSRSRIIRGRKFVLWEYLCNIAFNDLMTYDIIVYCIYIYTIYIYTIYVYYIYTI